MNLRPTLALATLSALSSLGAQQPPQATVVQPCREACRLALVPHREYGEDAGAGMIEASRPTGWLDESGRMYIGGPPASHVQLYGPDGSFLRRIGRSGAGPGELQHLTSLVVMEDGLFSVLDRRRGAIVTFDSAGALRSEARTRGWSPRGLQTIHIGGPLAVHHADIPTPELVGYPLHLVNLESGEVLESFGSLTGDYDPQSGLNHVIAQGPGRSVWLAEKYAYAIELWDSSRLVRSLRRDADWFPQVPLAELGHGWDERPSPLIASVAADDSLLWVAAGVADEQWEADSQRRDPALLYDTMIEVIDWRRGRVIGSQRFDDDYFHWVRPGLLGRAVVTPEGSIRYRTTRVQPLSD